MQKTIIVVHHSGSGDGPENNTAAIRRWHMGKPPKGPVDGPYRDIGYHALIEKVGDSFEVILGRLWDEDGAHTRGRNQIAFGVCLVGDFSFAPPPLEQLKKAAEFIRFLLRLFDLSIESVFSHRQLNDTDCPGHLFPWEEFLEMIGE